MSFHMNRRVAIANSLRAVKGEVPHFSVSEQIRENCIAQTICAYESTQNELSAAHDRELAQLVEVRDALNYVAHTFEKWDGNPDDWDKAYIVPLAFIFDLCIAILDAR